MKKIVLADNQSIFRAGIAKVLAAQEDVRIVAQCLDTEHLQQAASSARGSIVLFTTTLNLEFESLVRLIHSAASGAFVIA